MGIALISGASRGIGRATALLLAQEGYTVAVNYHHNINAATEVVNTIVASGGKATALRADISDEAQVMAMFEAIDRMGEPLAALVNNAGTVGLKSRVDEMSESRILHTLRTNVLGPILCSRHAVLRMSPRYGGQGGNIVNVSSGAARLGSPNEYVDYAASKGALDTFTLGLSKELAGEGIRVNAVRPGLIFTEFHALSGDPGRVSKLESSIPMGRGGRPEEVAEAIIWLLSDKASYATGTFIDLCGGR